VSVNHELLIYNPNHYVSDRGGDIVVIKKRNVIDIQNENYVQKVSTTVSCFDIPEMRIIKSKKKHAIWLSRGDDNN